MVNLAQTPWLGQAWPQDYTNTNLDSGLPSRAWGGSSGRTDIPNFTLSQPREPPQHKAGSLPALVGHCWTDTGGKKQENACVGENEPLPSLQAAWLGPPVLSTAHPSGHRFELGGPTRPAERRQRPLVVLVGLGLALGPLGLGIGGWRVGLLH